MKIVFDESKEDANLRKHGISLARASSFEWDESVQRIDNRRDYGEERVVALGYIGNRLHCLVFTIRCDDVRVISLRKASKREEKIYAET